MARNESGPGGRLRGEGGFALPTVIFMLLGAFAIAGVAVTSSIGAQKGTSRDLDTKDALAVAEAGAQQALVRYNAAAAEGSCVAPQTMQTDGWCSPAAGSLGDGADFTYWVAPTELPSDAIEIVSQGTVDGVSRRVHLSAHSAAESTPFADAGVIGRDSIDLDSNSDITADMATNGDIDLTGSSSVWICGNAQVGVGHDILPPGTTAHQCGEETTGSFTLPGVNQADVRTNNQNSKFFAQNPVSGKKSDVCWNGANAAGQASSACGSRELVIDGNSSLTMTSGNYSLCKLTMVSNSSLTIASGSTVRLYFDTPEACGYADGVSQLHMSSNSSISANGTSGATDVALLFTGSEALRTTITLASNTLASQACNQNFVVYAPRTDIEMASNTNFCGAIAGRNIHLNSNAHVTANNLAQSFQLPNAPAHYTVDRFVECPVADTSGGC